MYLKARTVGQCFSQCSCSVRNWSSQICPGPHHTRMNFTLYLMTHSICLCTFYPTQQLRERGNKLIAFLLRSCIGCWVFDSWLREETREREGTRGHTCRDEEILTAGREALLPTQREYVDSLRER